MLPPDVLNPFLVHKADDTVTLPLGHVPELHQAAYTKCREAVAQTRQSKKSLGVLVVGEAGSGKSHLLAQLRQEAVKDPKALFAVIRLTNAYKDCLWTETRARLVDELFRPYPQGTPTGNGFIRLLCNRFPNWSIVPQSSPGGLIGILFGGKKQPDLSPHLREFARTTQLDYDLLKVLPHLVDPHKELLARQWLEGNQLSEDDLTQLGLPVKFPSERELDRLSKAVVHSLLRLAGDASTMIICFDEVEAIQAGPTDTGVLKQFGALAVSLLAEDGPRVVLTSVRPRLFAAMVDAEVSQQDKIAQVRMALPMLNWEQTVRLARARLDAEPTCQPGRQSALANPDWPFDRNFLQGIYEGNRRSLTPRHLIRACRDRFEQLRDGPGPITPPDLSAQLTEEWERLHARFSKLPESIKFDTVLTKTLLWLVGMVETPFRVPDETVIELDYVNLVFPERAKGPKPLGVSFCNHDPAPLWRRLDKLLSTWETNRFRTLKSLAVLRDRGKQTNPASTKRLEALEQAGAHVLRLERDQLAHLAAAEALLTKVQDGKLERFGGMIVDVESFNIWMKNNLPGAIKEFLRDLFGVIEGPDSGTPTGPIPGLRESSHYTAARK